VGSSEHSNGQPGQGVLDAALSFRTVLHPLSKEGFQAWLRNCKLSSHKPAVFFDHMHGKTILNWHSSHHRFPHLVTPDASTGTSALLLFTAFLLADLGFQNTRRVSAPWNHACAVERTANLGLPLLRPA
jgi:hypothetical protein